MRVYVLVEDLDPANDPKNDKYHIHGVFETQSGAEAKAERAVTSLARVRILSFTIKGNPITMMDSVVKDLG